MTPPVADLCSSLISTGRPSMSGTISTTSGRLGGSELALGENVAFLFAWRLEDLKDKVLLAHAAGTGKIEGTGNLSQFGYVFLFEFCNGHSLTCEEIWIKAGNSKYLKGNSVEQGTKS